MGRFLSFECIVGEVNRCRVGKHCSVYQGFFSEANFFHLLRRFLGRSDFLPSSHKAVHRFLLPQELFLSPCLIPPTSSFFLFSPNLPPTQLFYSHKFHSLHPFSASSSSSNLEPSSSLPPLTSSNHLLPYTAVLLSPNSTWREGRKGD